MYYISDNEQLLMHKDSIFYFNKIYTIQHTGIENIANSIYNQTYNKYPNTYHYFDLWIYSICFPIENIFSLDIIFFKILIPLILSILSSQILNILQSFNNKNRYSLFFISLLSPLICPISYLTFGNEYLNTLVMSEFTINKLAFVGLLINVIFYFYYTKNYYSFFYTILFSCISFVTILPGVGGAAIIYFLYLFYNKKIKLEKTFWNLFINTVLVLIFIFYLYYPMLTDSFVGENIKIQSKIITFKEQVIRKIAVIRDSLYIIFVLYIPYFILFFKKYNFKIIKKLDFKHYFFFPLLPIFIGIITWIISFYYTSDTVQFFYVLLIPIFSVFIPVLIYKINSNFIVSVLCIFIIVNTLIISIISIKFNERYIKISKNTINQVKKFITKKHPRTAFLSNYGKYDTLFSEFNIDNYYFYPATSAFFSSYIDFKTDEVIYKNSRNYEFIIKLAQKTPFYEFYKNGKYESIVKAQKDFIIKNKIQYLSVTDDYILSSEIKKIAKDSIYIKEQKNTIYSF